MPRPVARPVTRPAARPVARILASIVGLLAAGLVGVGTSAPASAENVVTPGNFTGYGFDQCLAPTQRAMNAWLKHSPFLSVGIYISGDSRACRSQPNLTPDWISTQLRKGWRLLPITLGPQASCSTRFPRYGDDETIRPRPGRNGLYGRAREQGRAEAVKAVEAAQRLGIRPGSTLWYDLEGFDATKRDCRESALAFLSAWTYRLHTLDYVSGVYSSAGSGIKVLDDARVERPDAFHLPDQLWIARWSGVPNRINDPDHTYIRDDGWMPHARVHQYQGGHDETWGGVKINIDRNFLDLGKGSWAAPETHCGGVPVDFANYSRLRPGTTASDLVRALQCLLKEHGLYAGKLNGVYGPPVIEAVHAWQTQQGATVRDTWSRRNWITLHIAGPVRVWKFGSAGPGVRRLQRSLNAASSEHQLAVTGVFAAETDRALRAYQDRVGVRVSGVAADKTWAALRSATR